MTELLETVSTAIKKIRATIALAHQFQGFIIPDRVYQSMTSAHDAANKGEKTNVIGYLVSAEKDLRNLLGGFFKKSPAYFAKVFAEVKEQILDDDIKVVIDEMFAKLQEVASQKKIDLEEASKVYAEVLGTKPWALQEHARREEQRRQQVVAEIADLIVFAQTGKEPVREDVEQAA